MDKPTTPGGGDLPGFTWPEDSGSEQGFGATGVFGTLPAEELKPKPAVTPIQPPAGNPVKPPAGIPVQPAAIPLQPFELAAAARPSPPTPNPSKPIPPPSPMIQPAGGGPVLAEPVVHKVVLGSGTGEHPAELLDRIRMASAERAAVVEKPPAQVGPQGSGGFTELLRTLSGDAAAPSAKPAVVLAPPTGSAAPGSPAASMSGFTSLLQTLNEAHPAAPEKKAQPPLPVDLPMILASPPAPAASPGSVVASQTPPAPASQAPAAGGFTELLRMSDFAGPDAGPPQTGLPGSVPGFGESPTAPGAPQTGASTPGAFTQLFGTFSAAEAGMPAPVLPASQGFGGSEAGSFTRMLSLEQQSGPPPFGPPPPAFREEPVPLPGSMDYGRTPGLAVPRLDTREQDPFAPDPFSQALPPAPVESAPAAGGIGITRLIQMLDEPARVPAAPAVPLAEPPVGSSAKAGPGIWTQTFESLSEKSSSPPAAAAPSTPSWSAPPPPPPMEFAPVAPLAPPPQPSPQGAGSGVGPSEFTRIIDASKMREMAMRGGSGGAAPAPGGSGPSAGAMAPSGFAPPSFSPPAAPAPPPMPAMGGMPQPGGFAPPPPPAVSAPPLPTGKPAPPAGASKLQQFVPLLLVMIIVLLVVILVTVIFLMKH